MKNRVDDLLSVPSFRLRPKLVTLLKHDNESTQPVAAEPATFQEFQRLAQNLHPRIVLSGNLIDAVLVSNVRILIRQGEGERIHYDIRFRDEVADMELDDGCNLQESYEILQEDGRDPTKEPLEKIGVFLAWGRDAEFKAFSTAEKAREHSSWEVKRLFLDDD